jgi:hypothetical protein
VPSRLLVTSRATFDQAAWWNVERQKTQAFRDKADADAYQKISSDFRLTDY